VLNTERILRFIKDAGYTEYAVCKALKWGNGVISKWENHSPSIDKLTALSNFINVPVYELLGDGAGLPDEWQKKIAAEKLGSEIMQMFIDAGQLAPGEELTDELKDYATNLIRAAVAMEKRTNKG